MPSRPVRVVTQGPSEPVRVVTQGIVDPVRIILGTPSDPVRVVTGGVSTPIKIVAGSLDPIGDGLRADAALSVQYSGGNWVDPTSAHTWTNVNGTTSTSSAYGDMVTLDGTTQYIRTPSDTPDLTPGNHDFTIVAAVKFDVLTAAQAIMIKDNSNGDDEYYLYQSVSDFTSIPGFKFLINDGGVLPEIFSTSFGEIYTDVLYLIFAWYDATAQSINVQVNNGAIDSNFVPNPNGTIDTPTTFDIGGDSAGGSIPPVALLDGQVIIHFYNRKLTQDEKDYLWNDGAGRTLFP